MNQETAEARTPARQGTEDRSGRGLLTWPRVAAAALIPALATLFIHFPVYLNNPGRTVDAAGIFLVAGGIIATALGLASTWLNGGGREGQWLTGAAALATATGILIICRSQLA